MSLRTFARNCVEHTGMTPGKLVELLRVEAARDAIEKSDTPLEVDRRSLRLRRRTEDAKSIRAPGPCHAK